MKDLPAPRRSQARDGPLQAGRTGDPAPGLAALAGYRRDFRPWAQQPEPRVAISLDVLVADTAAEAADLLLPEAWAMARARTEGAFPALEPVSAVRAQPMSSRQRHYLKDLPAPRHSRARAGPLQAGRTDRRPAELVASSSTFDRAALAASDSALAPLFGQPGAGRAAAMASPSWP